MKTIQRERYCKILLIACVGDAGGVKTQTAEPVDRVCCELSLWLFYGLCMWTLLSHADVVGLDLNVDIVELT